MSASRRCPADFIAGSTAPSASASLRSNRPIRRLSRYKEIAYPPAQWRQALRASQAALLRHRRSRADLLNSYARRLANHASGALNYRLNELWMPECTGYMDDLPHLAASPPAAVTIVSTSSAVKFGTAVCAVRSSPSSEKAREDGSLYAVMKHKASRRVSAPSKRATARVTVGASSSFKSSKITAAGEAVLSMPSASSRRFTVSSADASRRSSMYNSPLLCRAVSRARTVLPEPVLPVTIATLWARAQAQMSEMSTETQDMAGADSLSLAPVPAGGSRPRCHRRPVRGQMGGHRSQYDIPIVRRHRDRRCCRECGESVSMSWRGAPPVTVVRTFWSTAEVRRLRSVGWAPSRSFAYRWRPASSSAMTPSRS